MTNEEQTKLRKIALVLHSMGSVVVAGLLLEMVNKSKPETPINVIAKEFDRHFEVEYIKATVNEMRPQQTIVLPSDKEGLIESKEDNIPIANPCPVCNGMGHFPRNEDDDFSLPEECETCGGSGVKL